MNIQWWCSAQNTAWTWSWRPYVGVWVMLAIMVALYVRLLRAAPADFGPLHRAAFGVAVATLWLALDWPLGALGAGYLASVHMLQFLLVGLVAPVFLLLSIPPATYARLGPRARATLRRVTQPLIALVIFYLVIFFTHWPPVVDGLMGSQAGSFVIDTLWWIAGLVFWWPLVSPVPARPGFGDVLRIGYLIAATILSTAPFLYLTFSQLPVYATYELAPPIEGISKRGDQQLAGLLMKMGGAVILWTAIAAIFFRSYERSEAGDA